MRATIVTYYILILLVIVGAFASMAQNNYGMSIIGYVCIAFALSFTTETIKTIRYRGINKQSYLYLIELIGLIIIAVIFSFRVFYIHFPTIELLFSIGTLLLITRFSAIIGSLYNATWKENRILCINAMLYYLSLIFYTLSMVVVTVNPALSEPFGALGFLCLVLFFAAGAYFNNLFFEGEKISAFDYLNRYNTKSVLIMMVYLLFSLYIGLTKFNIIPPLYSSQYPRIYVELVRDAESGAEKPVDGKFKHEEFKENYDGLLKKSHD